MGSFHKVLLLAVVSAAAMAAMTSTAVASQTVQVVNEDSGTTCGGLTSGSPCQTHWVGVATLELDLGFLGEVAETTCNLEVAARMSGVGEFAFDDTEHNTGPDANCATAYADCSMPWNGKGEEDGPVGFLQSYVDVCKDPAESDLNCEGRLVFALAEQDKEHYEMQYNHASIGNCEITVNLEVEHAQAGNHEIHVNHPQ